MQLDEHNLEVLCIAKMGREGLSFPSHFALLCRACKATTFNILEVHVSYVIIVMLLP